MVQDDFQPIEIQHKETFDHIFLQDPPETSELTFTNLFMWRHKYRPIWLQWEDCLLIILRPEADAPFGLPPVGPGNKSKALESLAEQLKQMTPAVRICRASEDFVEAHVDHDRYESLIDRDNSDYVYHGQDLIGLSGRRYHSKKNHLNRFLKNYPFNYREMDRELVEGFLGMQEKWCQMRECVESPELLSEDYAIREALTHFEELDYRGGAVEINAEIEAFSLGEPLNPNTAVIHIEKANPDIPGLYVAINQLFCKNAWSPMEYVNREQDLGIEGLRRAKESYHPHHMVNKYTLIPKE
ncbi:MAG: DUF2156 domain-containing protein [Desulfobacteraceae bacterium]|nr:DUF2156 domain-containing protein [Desulfobacteraceae bacterium]